MYRPGINQYQRVDVESRVAAGNPHTMISMLIAGVLERIAMLEFPSRAQAEAWYHSPEYQKILPYRLKATRCQVSDDLAFPGERRTVRMPVPVH